MYVDSVIILFIFIISKLLHQEIWEIIFNALQILVTFYHQVHENTEFELLKPDSERRDSGQALNYVRKTDDGIVPMIPAPRPSNIGVSASLDDLDKDFSRGIALQLEYDRVGHAKNQKPDVPKLNLNGL